MKIGFIGTGNMASAIIAGVIANSASSNIRAKDILVYDKNQLSTDKAVKDYGVIALENNKEVATLADVIFLTIKPKYYFEVINEIKSSVTPHKIIITVAPGKTLKILEEQFDTEVKIVRTMPNTPALVLEGMTAVCANEYVSSKELEIIIAILNGIGKTEIIEEDLMDAVVAVSGSSPAYIFMLIEAMADAAVLQGMARQTAYKFAAQAILGSAKMVLELNKHPAELKDMVCSPGGTTIEAVTTLEEKGFRSSVMEAMKKCAEKAKDM